MNRLIVWGWNLSRKMERSPSSAGSLRFSRIRGFPSFATNRPLERNRILAEGYGSQTTVQNKTVRGSGPNEPGLNGFLCPEIAPYVIPSTWSECFIIIKTINYYTYFNNASGRCQPACLLQTAIPSRLSISGSPLSETTARHAVLPRPHRSASTPKAVPLSREDAGSRQRPRTSGYRWDRGGGSRVGGVRRRPAKVGSAGSGNGCAEVRSDTPPARLEPPDGAGTGRVRFAQGTPQARPPLYHAAGSSPIA